MIGSHPKALTPEAYTKIPFNRPYVTAVELAYVQQAIEALHLSGDGAFTKRAHPVLQTMTQAPASMLTTSCTHALEMMALLLDLKPGDEVIVPTFTFVSTANAFVLRGARPVFGDSRADTLNLDESLLDSLVTPNTRAIVVVHYAGVACEMDSILSRAASRGIPVLEDNAHGLMGAYRGKALGSFGVMAAQRCIVEPAQFDGLQRSQFAPYRLPALVHPPLSVLSPSAGGNGFACRLRPTAQAGMETEEELEHPFGRHRARLFRRADHARSHVHPSIDPPDVEGLD